jgi:hypothetical protein
VVHIPVHVNRSRETLATLYDGAGNTLHTFRHAHLPARCPRPLAANRRVRTHGNDIYGNNTWPSFNDTDPGVNVFGANGNTPTGISSFDLNSPEDEPRLFGPYPVNRFVNGALGNQAFLISNVRDGMCVPGAGWRAGGRRVTGRAARSLMHTGEWPAPWNTSMDMPNSDGCVHGHPEDIKRVWQLLVRARACLLANALRSARR